MLDLLQHRIIPVEIMNHLVGLDTLIDDTASLTLPRWDAGRLRSDEHFVNTQQ